jgi:hypothetical protein
MYWTKGGDRSLSVEGMEWNVLRCSYVCDVV